MSMKGKEAHVKRRLWTRSSSRTRKEWWCSSTTCRVCEKNLTLMKIAWKEILPGANPPFFGTKFMLPLPRDLATIHHICEGHLEELNDISKENMVQIKTLVTVTEMLSKHKQKYTGELRKYYKFQTFGRKWNIYIVLSEMLASSS